LRREISMNRRRERILKEARNLLASREPEALSLRSLAKAAEVTVPTIYNLIGGKSQILLAVCRDVVEESGKRFVSPDGGHDEPLSRLEEITRSTVEQKARKSTFYRSTYVAWDQLMRSDQFVPEIEAIRRYAASKFAHLIRQAQGQGLLRGKIAPEILGMEIYQGHHEAALEWVYRRISKLECMNRSLVTLYLVLSADAGDKLRDVLAERIDALHPSSPRLLAKSA